MKMLLLLLQNKLRLSLRRWELPINPYMHLKLLMPTQLVCQLPKFTLILKSKLNQLTIHQNCKQSMNLNTQLHPKLLTKLEVLQLLFNNWLTRLKAIASQNHNWFNLHQSLLPQSLKPFNLLQSKLQCLFNKTNS